MDKLIEEIRTHFASQIQGLRPLNLLNPDYKGYTFRQGVEYGVAVESSSDKDLYEEASQITIKRINNMGVNYIALSCCDEEFRNEFAHFAAYFLIPGENGENRRLLLESPVKWWEGWIGMLGNRIGQRQCYDTIAEMMALEELYKLDKSTKWTASQAGSHDIESDALSVEVKSTVKKSETTVTISSQFQLASVKPLQLWFFRMEASEHGMSINDLTRDIVAVGYDENLIESQLCKRGFIPGNSSRDRKYVLLEKRKFVVDDQFPRIVESSFKNGIYPNNIVKILYTIDLEGLDYFV